jgi:hypothetical protein
MGIEMLDKRRFQEQMQLLSTHFMREISVELLDEYWKQFSEKDQKIWDKTVDDVMREAQRFPVIATFRYYYEVNTPPKQSMEFPGMEDLDKQAKTAKAKYYLELIHGLLEEKIKVDDPRVQKCLDEQGGNKVFKCFDPQRRIFKKFNR